METHISFPEVSVLAKKYPKTAGSLFATYNDLLLVQMWVALEVIDIPSCSRGALRGRRPNSVKNSDTIDAVVPCAMAEVLSLAWIKNAFKDLKDPPELYLAVCTEDSSLVYYKISRGFTKPPL